MPQYETSTASAVSTDFAAYSAAAWSPLVRTAHLLTGDFHEAEDLVRTTLAEVYSRWRRVPRDDVDFHVRRSLVRNNLGRIRRRRVARTPALLPIPLLPEPMRRRDARHTEPVERRTAAAEALATLPARQRTVLVLRYWDDLTEAEIAELLGCSPGKVRTHVRRGLAALRAHPAYDVCDRPHPVSGAHP
ncbi:RNA polymerase subunit sigma-24 [Streptomyces hygroscopicus]|uniref:SigE family RNA polymerase sigma factor n=1 Tax=Streptomyces hygroscopicus TaxID=1912 RepID=UPI002240E046|nr:SigE family RNA polymerase sigma factor [Streptomyces hygroscopicus]MCW7942631.1 RNA polymerase subunit sigma-24 [Streptomyces hygroscopicus]